METQSSPLGSVDQQVTRYKQVLDVMPAGVILLDANGRVAEANPEAHRLLGEPLTQQRWFDVIQRAFSPRDDDGHEDMTETRLLQSRVSDLQRLSSLGKMVASLAHQVRTPLSSAILYASNLGAPNLNNVTRQRFQFKLLDPSFRT